MPRYDGAWRKVKKFNLTAIENRYGREGLYLGLQVLWLYRLCAVLDLFVFNSIEFWAGTNPVNGKSALAELPLSEAEKIGFHDVNRARVELVNDHEAKLHLEFRNGDRVAFNVIREERTYTVSYMGRVFYEGRIEEPDDRSQSAEVVAR